MNCKNQVTFMQCKLLCGQLLPATLQSPINPDSQPEKNNSNQTKPVSCVCIHIYVMYEV